MTALFRRLLRAVLSRLFSLPDGAVPIERPAADGADSGELAEAEWRRRQRQRKGEATQEEL